MKRPDASTSKTVRKRTKEAAPETDADRAEAIVTSLRTGEPSSDEMYEAFWQLDSLPVNDVRKAFTSWLGPLPDIDRLDPVTRRAHGFPLPALRLRTLSVVRDADILDLGPIAEAQLRIAGTTWDGADLAPEDRLDGEIEDSLAGTIEHRVLADVEASDGTPLFDVLLFAESSGVVFAAGTTTVIALIAYRKVETRDRRVRTAVEDALYAPAIATVAKAETVVEEVVVSEPTRAKKTAIEKPVAKKAVPKEKGTTTLVPTKTVRKKTVAKKIGAKKSAAKKSAPNKSAGAPAKAGAKKVAAKKTATKKPVAKKALAKKSGTKTSGASGTKKLTAKKTAKRARSTR